MARMRKKNYKSATEAFIEASPWLGPQHYPAITSMRRLAEELDNEGELKAALVAQYNLTFRSLLKESPSAQESNPVEELIRAAQALSD